MIQASHLLFKYYRRSDGHLGNLKKYQYMSPGSTPLDDLLNKYWWTPISAYIPANIHPNTLTVIALMFSFGVAYWPQQLLSIHSDRMLPRIVHLTSALAYFIYQSLDAVDGKQARRTGLSSPLGQLMDHGCDALTTYYSVFLIASTIQIPLSHSFAISLLLTVISFQLIYYGWYELRHGVYKTNTAGLVGVTEGQYAIIVLNLISFVCPTLWSHSLASLFGYSWLGRFIGFFTFGLKINQLVFWPCMLAMIFINFQEIEYLAKIINSGGDRHVPGRDSWKENVKVKSITRDWFEIGFHMYTQAALCLSHVLSRHPFPIITAVCFFGAQHVWRLIVDSLLDSPPRLYDWTNAPYYVVSLILATNCVADCQVTESVVCWLLGFYAVAQSIGFAMTNLVQMRDSLKVTLFQVPEEARRAASSSSAPPPTPQIPPTVPLLTPSDVPTPAGAETEIRSRE